MQKIKATVTLCFIIFSSYTLAERNVYYCACYGENGWISGVTIPAGFDEDWEGGVNSVDDMLEYYDEIYGGFDSCKKNGGNRLKCGSGLNNENLIIKTTVDPYPNEKGKSGEKIDPDYDGNSYSQDHPYPDF